MLRVVRTPVLAYVGADEPTVDIGEMEKEVVAQAESYLADLVTSVKQDGIKVRPAVLKGLAASRIIADNS